LIIGCGKPAQQDPPQAKAASLAATGKTVKLVIDYGDGVEKHFPSLAWREGLTVLEAMRSTSENARGLHFNTWNNATGEAALVEQIDGVKNEGGAAEAKNWTFKINGKRGQVGAGVQALHDGDVVVWKFGVYEIE
jgi:hypothetical protein